MDLGETGRMVGALVETDAFCIIALVRCVRSIIGGNDDALLAVMVTPSSRMYRKALPASSIIAMMA